MTKPLQFHFRQQTYVVQFKLGFSLLCLFLFILCCVLGVWQLHRYANKKLLLTTYQQRLASPFTVFSTNAVQFQRVKILGSYVNKSTMLVQNRFYHDQLGFEVFTPLHISGEQKLLLVDRGWIPKSDVTAVEKINGEQAISGYIKWMDDYQFILGKNILEPNKKPLVLQRIDLADISQATQQTYYPFFLRLDAGAPNGFVRDWTIVTVTPERHLAYAVQWFALALVLLIAYFCFCCERRDP